MNNQPAIDPTKNVLEHVAAAVKRMDDLREAESHTINQLLVLNTQHIRDLMEAESKRIDAIRSVDTGAITMANEKAVQQAEVLAKQVSESAENLRTLVSSTIQSEAAQRLQITTQLADRISLLEKSKYEVQGTGTGRKEMWGWITAGILLLITILSFLLKFI